MRIKRFSVIRPALFLVYTVKIERNWPNLIKLKKLNIQLILLLIKVDFDFRFKICYL